MLTPGDASYRAAQRADLLRFVDRAWHPLGFGWLDENGVIDPDRPVELWITCRMTHVAALGALAGEAPAPDGPSHERLLELVEHGVASLRGALRDQECGGWFASVGPDGPCSTAKQAYGHAFVVLAASSAVSAGASGAEALLAEALDVAARRFWDEGAGLVVDEWDREWCTLDPYRGVNANMHAVESFLAAGDVTGERIWHERAGRIAARVVAWARENQWRIPEHFDESWTPRLDHHRDQPAHPFQPFGATVGHGLEWARLLLAVEATLGPDAPQGLLEAATALTEGAVLDGWSPNGIPGFVYTTDWEGQAVVELRMHWVVAEAINTAWCLWRRTGEQHYLDWTKEWWLYVDRFLVDHERGSWHHELDDQNRVSRQVWPGKPDVYHAYQTALLPECPLTPSFATALADTARAVHVG